MLDSTHEKYRSENKHVHHSLGNPQGFLFLLTLKIDTNKCKPCITVTRDALILINNGNKFHATFFRCQQVPESKHIQYRNMVLTVYIFFDLCCPHLA